MIESATFIKYVARCDSCGFRHRALADGFSSIEEATHAAIQRGWKLNDDATGIFCLACSTMPAGKSPLSEVCS